MKSLVSRLHRVACGILADVRMAYPPLQCELVRDERALALYVANRGIGFFTLDLPSLDDALVGGLETGFLTLGGPLTKAVSKRVRVPKFLRGLWLKVFDNGGSLREDPDIDAIDFLRTFFDLGRKLELSCTPARNNAAIKEFVDVENRLPRPTLRWSEDDLFDGNDVRCLSFSSMRHGSSAEFSSDDPIGLSDEDSHLLERLDSICRDVSVAFGLFDSVGFDLQTRARFKATVARNGPGAVSDRTSRQEKFCFDNWPEKLQGVFPFDYFACIGSEVGRKQYVNNEHASKLLMVPKTTKTPRLIASEPSYHQWCQQIVLQFMVERISETPLADFIDFRSQESSHPLVLLGSQDRSLVTVDLSSASDRLSCFVVERAFAKNLSLLNAFHACRTRVVGPSRRVNIDFAFLRKFATMGSALTFPVQSVFFLCVCLASLPGRPRLKEQAKRYKGQVRVFGDDIIIPRTGYADLVRLLTILGLKVNKRKTFVDGHFRESCGLDAYKGYNITPCKPRSLDPTTPTGRQSMIDLSNNLFLKGMWKASEVVASELPQMTLRHLPVVQRDSGSVGFISNCGSDFTRLRKRWNKRLQRLEVLCSTFSTKTETTRSDGTDYTFQALHNLERAHGPDGAPSRLRHLKITGEGTLGRVVKAVTRERRSWEVLAIDTVSPDYREVAMVASGS